MVRKLISGLCGVLGLALACGSPTAPTSDDRTFTFDFANGPQDWIQGFADYSAARPPLLDAPADPQPLPPPLGQSRSALQTPPFGIGVVFYKRQVAGLLPNGIYDASFIVEFATGVPHGCVGAEGPPGESVAVKTGASAQEPKAVLAGGRYPLNIDMGVRSKGGADALVLGNIANSIACASVPPGKNDIFRQWELKTLASPPGALRVHASPDGSIWLLFAFDSGFFGPLQLYFTKFSANFQHVS